MSTEGKTYEELFAMVTQLQDEGRLPTHVTRAQAIDWAYGNTKIENPDVTRKMVEAAMDEKESRFRGLT